jgi:phospholipid-binding lipoprotein MlaA
VATPSEPELGAIEAPASAGRPAAPHADAGQPVDEELVVTARRRTTQGDPLEKVNAASFEITQDVDRAVIGPVALAYADAVPRPVRAGVRNFLSNLAEPVVFLNFVLQLKPGSAARTVGRFAINSTLGVAGLVDVAKRPAFGLPRRPNGFGYTLGYYGVKPGAFLYVPLVGPTTVRDLVGGGIDRLVLPTLVGVPFSDPAYSASTGTVSSLDRRVEIDGRLRELRQTSEDPYAALRQQYLERRQAAIDDLRRKR